MKKQGIIIASTLLCLLVAGCSKASEAKDEAKYQDKNINIIRKMEKKEGAEKATPVVDKTMSLRFYEETPNVPYVKVSDYFLEFFNNPLKLEKKNGFYKYSLEDGSYITFNAKEEMFAGYNIVNFNNHPDGQSVTGKTFLSDGVTSGTTKHEKVISLKNYSIDIHEDGKEAYVPLTFLSKLAGGFSMYNAQYNGKDIYVIDGQGELGLGVRDDSYYKDSYYEVLDDYSTARPVDLVKYNYGELCFVFDNLRGYTSQLVFGDNNLLSLGLNGLLEHYYPVVKDLLLSTNKEDYYIGTFCLFAGLGDGGHTGVLASSPAFTAAMEKAMTVQEMNTVLSEFVMGTVRKQFDKVSFANSRKTAFNLTTYSEANPNYYYYDSTNKTAYVGFEHFVVDYAAWDNFYNGKGEIPVASDTFAYIRDKMYQAKKDGATNFVVDLTTNGGGDSGALQGLVGLFNKAKSTFDVNDTFNKCRISTSYNIDVNLDGKWDEQDAEELKQFEFHVGILTSKVAFSCGNLLPSVLKGLGYKILGEKSGGGSCAIIVESTADGVPYVHSSYHCLSDAAGNNIDGGVPVDFAIERTPTAENPLMYDCSNFYDVATVAAYLNSAY